MKELASTELVTILIAEDDDGHAFLIQENLRAAGVSNPIIRFQDRVETLNFLHKKGDGLQRESMKPYLLLLDIKMPRLDGIETLKAVKADSELMKIPVIMLTTTDNPREVEECYKLGCNCYLTKPVHFGQFAEVLNRLGLFISILKIALANGDKGGHGKDN